MVVFAAWLIARTRFVYRVCQWCAKTSSSIERTHLRIMSNTDTRIRTSIYGQSIHFAGFSKIRVIASK